MSTSPCWRACWTGARSRAGRHVSFAVGPCTPDRCRSVRPTPGHISPEALSQPGIGESGCPHSEVAEGAVRVGPVAKEVEEGKCKEGHESEVERTAGVRQVLAVLAKPSRLC